MNAGESEGVFVERRAIEVEQAESASRELLADIQRKIPQVLQAEYRWPFLKLGDSDATTNMARAFGEVGFKTKATYAPSCLPTTGQGQGACHQGLERNTRSSRDRPVQRNPLCQGGEDCKGEHDSTSYTRKSLYDHSSERAVRFKWSTSDRRV